MYFIPYWNLFLSKKLDLFFNLFYILPEVVVPVPVGAVPDFCCRLGTFGKLNILQKDGKTRIIQPILTKIQQVKNFRQVKSKVDLTLTVTKKM